MANPLKQLMPMILEHEGVWEGEYQHIDKLGNIIDQHKSRVECVFPSDGPVVYLQKNQFTWQDGRVHTAEFGGVMHDSKIYWDTETFKGYGWAVSDRVFLLELERKDTPGASFTECIIMGSSKKKRARTWHWFKDGECYQRTLCNEYLLS